MQAVAALISVLIVLVARRATGSLAHPATLFCAYWSALLVLLTFVFTGLTPAPRVSLLITMTMLGALLAVGISPSAAQSTLWRIDAARWLYTFVLASAIAIVAAAVLTQMANGVSVRSLVSFEVLSQAARRITTLRYSGDLNAPASATLLLGIGYAGAMASAFARRLATTPLSQGLVLTAPALAATYYTATTTARAPFLIATCITAASWFVAWAVEAGGRPRLRPKQQFSLIVAALAVLGVFASATFLRAGSTGADARGLVIDRIGVYAVGSLPALESRLDEPEPLYLGRLLFEGVLSLFEPDAEIYATHPPFVTIGDGLQTNVFTSFWALSEDFGLPGALALSIIFVLVAAAALRAAVVKGSMPAASVYVMWAAFTFFSQTTLIFSFTNVLFAFILGSVVLTRGVRLTPLTGAVAIASVKRPSRESLPRVPAPLGGARR